MFPYVETGNVKRDTDRLQLIKYKNITPNHWNPLQLIYRDIQITVDDDWWLSECLITEKIYLFNKKGK